MMMEVPDWAYGVPPVSVVGEGFCFPYPMELTVQKKIKGLSKAQFDVFDQTGNLLLQVDGGVWNLKMKRVLRDPVGFPLLTMYGKALTFWHKWSAYPGQSIEENALFTVKQSHPLQIKKELNVFLHDKDCKEDKAPNFHVTGSYTSLSFKVFHDRRLIAEVKHNFTLESFYKGREKYSVKVYPEVDYAFIIALLVVLDENDTP